MKQKQTDAHNESVRISGTSKHSGDEMSKFKANLKTYLSFCLTYSITQWLSSLVVLDQKKITSILIKQLWLI